MKVLLTPAVRDAAERSVLCWLATVDAAGQPNVTPKEAFAVADDEHLVIANIASPGSAANVAANPRVCMSFVDVFVQKGFKVLGVATDVAPSDPAFARWVAPLRAIAATVRGNVVPMDTDSLTVLGIAGSLREGSDEYQHSLKGVLENARETLADGELVDETVRELVRELLAAFAWWARILREARKPA